MPFLSPSALEMHLPRARAVSSIMWCLRSPSASISTSMRLCFEKPAIMWSRNFVPVVTLLFPVPSTFTLTLVFVSLVCASTCAILDELVTELDTEDQVPLSLISALGWCNFVLLIDFDNFVFLPTAGLSF